MLTPQAVNIRIQLAKAVLTILSSNFSACLGQVAGDVLREAVSSSPCATEAVSSPEVHKAFQQVLRCLAWPANPPAQGFWDKAICYYDLYGLHTT